MTSPAPQNPELPRAWGHSKAEAVRTWSCTVQRAARRRVSPTVTRDERDPCCHLCVLEAGRMSQVERQVVIQSLKWGSWLLAPGPGWSSICFYSRPGSKDSGSRAEPHWEVKPGSVPHLRHTQIPKAVKGLKLLNCVRESLGHRFPNSG